MFPCAQVQEFYHYVLTSCNTSTLYIIVKLRQGMVQKCYVMPIQYIINGSSLWLRLHFPN